MTWTLQIRTIKDTSLGQIKHLYIHSLNTWINCSKVYLSEECAVMELSSTLTFRLVSPSDPRPMNAKDSEMIGL